MNNLETKNELYDFEARLVKSDGDGIWLQNELKEDENFNETMKLILKEFKEAKENYLKKYKIFNQELTIKAEVKNTYLVNIQTEFLSRKKTYHVKINKDNSLDFSLPVRELKTDILKYVHQVKHREKTTSKGFIAIDAAPYIMSKVRTLFPQGKNSTNGNYVSGKYTHKPLILPLNLMTAKEISWLMMRYVFDVSPELSDEINQLTNQYDELQRNRKKSLTENVKMMTPDGFFKLNPKITPEQHQLNYENFVYNGSKRNLLADPMGLGKTLSCSLLLRNPQNLPAILVAKPTLIYQHEKELQMYYPDMKIKVVRGKNNYEIDQNINLIIIGYNLLQYWEDYLIGEFPFQMVIFDEVSELRGLDTNKRSSALSLSQKAKISLGADGFPVWNLGSDIFSIIDVLDPGSLGTFDEFKREWCDYDGAVCEPTLLNSFLKNRGLMIRRTHEEANRKKDVVYTTITTLETPEDFEDQDHIKMLSRALLSGNVGSKEYSDSVSQFDFKLRMATGKIKSGAVAEYVRQVLAENDKVVLCGWHHEVYDKWREMLSDMNPAFITGNETTKEKDDERLRFIEDPNCKVIIISLRSGAGFNGLQFVCNNIIFGELDWTNAAHEQLITRLARWGQTKPVYAHYLVLDSMSDPFIVERLDLKRSQHYGIVEGKESDSTFMDIIPEQASLNKMREMAKKYLESVGEEAPEVINETGLLGEINAILKGIKISASNEDSLQRDLYEILSSKLSHLNIEREVRITKKSRLDFLIKNQNGDQVIIECKNTTKNRQDAIRQVRRYIEEVNPSAVILFVPWAGAYNFKVDGVPVIIHSYSSNSL